MINQVHQVRTFNIKEADSKGNFFLGMQLELLFIKFFTNNFFPA